MSSAHRARRRLTRRHLLGLAGLAAVPLTGLAVHGIRSGEAPAEATTPPAPAVASAGPAPSVAAQTVTAGGGTVPFRPGRTILGSYLALEGRSFVESLALRRRQTGREQRIVHVFYDWTDTLPARIDGLPAGATPMVSWRGTAYSDITSGGGDARIAQAARQLKRLGRPVLLRWGWEMNGDWYRWGAVRNGEDPGAYVECWKRIHRIFADEKAKNVSWVWSPNWNPAPVAEWNSFKALYPGDDYVDWVGVSGYNLHRETPDTLFDPVYREFSARKPLMITEVSAVDRGGRTKADWITLFAQWVETHPAVGGVVWFDTDTHPGYAEKWRVDTDADSLAAYVAMAKSVRFSG